MTLDLLLRIAGGGLVVLSIFHAVLWRTLNWSSDSERMSPLNARVFFVHTFFIAFVLFALGVLSLGRPDLLLAPSELARLLLSGVVAFWIARLVIQPLIFDRAMRAVPGWAGSSAVRIGVNFVWLGYVAVYGAALLAQMQERQP
jgi:hypothetical protein